MDPNHPVVFVIQEAQKTDEGVKFAPRSVCTDAQVAVTILVSQKIAEVTANVQRLTEMKDAAFAGHFEPTNAEYTVARVPLNVFGTLEDLPHERLDRSLAPIDVNQALDEAVSVFKSLYEEYKTAVANRPKTQNADDLNNGDKRAADENPNLAVTRQDYRRTELMRESEALRRSNMNSSSTMKRR